MEPFIFWQVYITSLEHCYVLLYLLIENREQQQSGNQATWATAEDPPACLSLLLLLV